MAGVKGRSGRRACSIDCISKAYLADVAFAILVLGIRQQKQVAQWMRTPKTRVSAAVRVLKRFGLRTETTTGTQGNAGFAIVKFPPYADIALAMEDA